jgi:hypothetical protein
MDMLSIFSAVGLAVFLVVLPLIGRSFLPAYFAEKGKSQATREDVEHLTKLVEGAKTEYAMALEQRRATLLTEGHILERKRKSYEEICAGLRVFINGHQTPDSRDRFLAAYALSWLWANDEVLSALNHFLHYQIQVAAVPGSVSQLALRQSYVEVILAMRKDSGFETTPAAVSDYQFVFF